MEDTWELHVPFMNYMGPGTHVSDRVHKGILPTSQSDAASLIHDIEYLNYTDQSIPDSTAVTNAGYLAGPMYVAFKIKQVLGFNIGEQNIPVYEHLRNIIDNDPRFDSLAKYEMHWSDGQPVHKVNSIAGTNY